MHILNLISQTEARTSVKVCELLITLFDLCDHSVHHRPLGLSALLVRPVFLLLPAAAGGHVRARLPAMASSLLRAATVARRVAVPTLTGHLQALGANRLPVTRFAATAGVWIRVMSLSAWPGYLGDDADLKAPRTESGKPQEGGDLKGMEARHQMIKSRS